jgi:hypothetical protein
MKGILDVVLGNEGGFESTVESEGCKQNNEGVLCWVAFSPHFGHPWIKNVHGVYCERSFSSFKASFTVRMFLVDSVHEGYFRYSDVQLHQCIDVFSMIPIQPQPCNHMSLSF